jgi:hypothetical protein
MSSRTFRDKIKKQVRLVPDILSDRRSSHYEASMITIAITMDGESRTMTI